ncbi:MAG: hypothetical protein JOZ81_09160 [Chloroflexi bacterium]|nr:hypothetical protein [Chloroflexota bacterium]MBV9547336.1 hypothetical protein [Chloroflexota bacterium]
MPQYLLSIYQPDEPPPPEVMARMGEIMANVNAVVDDAKATGAWVFNGALHSPSTATVVRLQRGEMLLTDGPYTEGKEHIGGFLIVDAADLDSALTWAHKLASALGSGSDSLPIEVRPFQDDRQA